MSLEKWNFELCIMRMCAVQFCWRLHAIKTPWPWSFKWLKKADTIGKVNHLAKSEAPTEYRSVLFPDTTVNWAARLYCHWPLPKTPSLTLLSDMCWPVDTIVVTEDRHQVMTTTVIFTRYPTYISKSVQWFPGIYHKPSISEVRAV